jgi:hypothetical protein
MPVICPSTYLAPPFFSNGHIQTVFPALFRKVTGVHYQRERIITPDDDFLDLDWAKVGSHRMAILSHGLEGSTERNYIRGMIKALHKRGWDALAWNYRGCSGEPNKKLYSYHSGATEDLHTIISHVMAQNTYSEMVLIGFSLGGNITLKYLGERGHQVNSLIKKAVAFSVPCDLRSSAMIMAQPSRRIYMKSFLRTLRKKIQIKMQMMPGQICDDGYRRIKTFKQFDDRYTAPIHGFKDAEDYWEKASSKQFLRHIRIPTLLVNAKDDPFLAGPCFPIEEAEANPNFFLEIPESGGHLGFITFNNDGEYWPESRAMSFMNDSPSTHHRDGIATEATEVSSSTNL